MIRLQRLEKTEQAVSDEQAGLTPETISESWLEYYDLEIDNRRRARRVNQMVPVRYRMSGEPVETSYALNISQTGARVVLRGATSSFRNDMTLELSNQVDVLARTVWEQPMPGGHCRIAGVTFEGMLPSQRKALQGLLNQIDNP